MAFYIKHIRLSRKHTLRTVIRLFNNMLILLFWRIKKLIFNIDHPVVHLYTICWNEEQIIPFMLQHYNEFVDHYYIYDNYSDDATDTLLAQQENITVHKFDTGGTFNDVVHQQIKNNAWKKSRGKADFVIVCDMDEFLYHPEMVEFLQNCIKEKYSFFVPKGYDMYSEKFPEYDANTLLIDKIQNGVYNDLFNKSILFDPHRLVEIDFAPGAHICKPLGIMKTATDNTLLLLHYKNLGIEYILKRITTYRNRLSKINLEKKFGEQYLKENEQITEDFYQNLNKADKII